MVPTGSMWGTGFRVMRPSIRAVGSPLQQGHVAVGHLVDDDGKEEDHGHEGRFQE